MTRQRASTAAIVVALLSVVVLTQLGAEPPANFAAGALAGWLTWVLAAPKKAKG